MKKILYILGGIMFISVVLQPFIAIGQNTTDSQYPKDEDNLPMSYSNVFSKLLDKVGLDSDLDWGESFGYDDRNEDKVGQNMYLVIYKKMNVDPAQKAVKDISDSYSINAGDTNLILGGNYSPIISRKPTLSQEELMNTVMSIQEEFSEMKDIYELEARIKSAVEPSEMFANGDLSDSGFDLINDLTLIEEILFLKTSEIDIGKSYVSSKGGASDYGQAPVSSEEILAPSGYEPPTKPINEGDGSTSSGSKSGSGAYSITPTKKTSINPNECFSDNKYTSSLKDFDNSIKSNDSLKDLSFGEKPTSSSPLIPDSLKTDSTIPFSEHEPALPKTDVDVAPIDSAEPNNWLKDRNCEGPFCIELRFVKSPAESSYSNSDNCIACHVEKINDILGVVVNYSLVPSKVPGNLLESAECKKAMSTALGSINSNIYMVGMPVKTPLNDDIMYGTNIDDEWANYCESVIFPSSLCPDPSSSPEDYNALENTSSEKAILLATTQISDEATQADVVNRTNEIQKLDKNSDTEIKKLLEQQELSNKNIMIYQPLKYELDTMNHLFMNIQNVLHSLHEEVDDFPGIQACYELKNKNECE